MERETNSDKIEKLASDREETQRLLGHLGLVDATLFEYPHRNTPEDDRFIVLGNN